MAHHKETRLVGDWEILDRIGSGSFSFVWKARHRKTGQLAAVKEIATAKLSTDFSRCLDAELAAMRGMHHPNIVAFYELIKEPGRIFIVMEYCRDGELQAVISKGRCSERYVQQCMIQLAAGLKALRSAKIRDLKPANLLLSDGVLKIADFGFARNLPSKNLADTLCGSPLYMAPEVLQRKRYDARADLWSVGVILYEMLVGLPPFGGQNYIHLMNNIETKPLKLPKSVAKAISKNCLDLLVHLLQRNAHRRMDYDAFFQHPFLADPIPEDTSESTPGPSNLSLPAVRESHESEDVAIGEDEEFSYSVEDGFVLISRMGSESSEDKHPELSPRQATLMRIAEWVMECTEMSPSKARGFFRALTAIQIIQHVVDSSTPVNPGVSKKLQEALSKAQQLSDNLTAEEAKEKCRASQVYSMFMEGAVICSQKAAADELCGQFYDSCQNYTKSLELLTFLSEEGSGVKLNPPFKLKAGEKQKLTDLISAIIERKSKCLPSRST